MAHFAYLLAPLNEHFDSGFGATGNAFKAAADSLWDSLPDRAPIFNERLPLKYLYRHAIELFLKSTIVIVHRRLRLPYGHRTHDSEPYVQVAQGWKPFHQVHSIATLWQYVRRLFEEQKPFFDTVRTVNWGFRSEMDNWIEAIESHDPRSTFFRYPNPSEPSVDAFKSSTATASPSELSDRFINSKPGGINVILYDEHTEDVLGGYYYSGDALK